MKYSLEELEKLLEYENACICEVQECTDKMQKDITDLKQKINLLKAGIIFICAGCLIHILASLM